MKQYPFSLFITGFITNLLFRFIWLLLPSIILLIIGIWNQYCLWIGLTLLLLDIVLSITAQLRIRHTTLYDDDPNFKELQDAILSDNWMDNVTEIVRENIELSDKDENESLQP